MYEIFSFIIDNLLDILFWIFIFLFVVIFLLQKDFIGKGFYLLNKGRYLDAISFFKRKSEKSPNKPGTYYALGYCYYMLGYFSNAINNFEKAIELKLNRVSTYYLLAILNADENKIGEALGYLEKGEVIQNKTGFLNRLTKYERSDYLGWVYFKKGEISKSFKFYDVAIPDWINKIKKDKKLGENFSSPCYRIGMILMKKNDIETARKMFKSAINASPESIFAKKSQEELGHLPSEEII